jgi:hypothetical protein
VGEPVTDDDGPGPRVDGPTERLGSPREPARDPTLSFTPPPPPQSLEMSGPPRPRRTSRILWTLFVLILAVIVASGVYLVVTVAQR